MFPRSGGHKTKETYPTRPGSPTPCKQGLTRSTATNELGFSYNCCGTCSSSYRDVFRMASPMVISIGPPTCVQDDGVTHAKVLCFSYFSHLVLSVVVSSGLRGCRSFLLRSFKFAFCSPPVTVKVLILFVPVNSIEVDSIASLCSNYSM